MAEVGKAGGCWHSNHRPTTRSNHVIPYRGRLTLLNQGDDVGVPWGIFLPPRFSKLSYLVYVVPSRPVEDFVSLASGEEGIPSQN